ncbi:MAG: glycosyltransferase family 4 protein [Candidatus Pacebacteria bacterium]|nr:glycosyltransferase family 4 protein [Candidatus Paceibacterota bacterium]
MIKILMLIPYLSLSGGVSNYIKLLIKELNSEKYQIKYLEVGKTGSPFKDYFYPLLIFTQFLKLKRILKNDKPDIVHLNPSLTYAAIFRDFIFLKTIKKEGFPVLFFIHGWQEKISKKFENRIVKYYFKKRFEIADAIVVLANQFKNKLIELGIDANKIYVSTTMVKSDLYIPKDKIFSETCEILFCSNMKKEKGPYELLDAVPLIIKKFSDTYFNFVGDGKELEKLKRKTRKMGIEKNVSFNGYKIGNEKIKFFKKAHIFVLPSYSEGFPTVVIEAMAAGLPLVVKSVGGLEDAIEEGKQGLIIYKKPLDPKEIAEKIFHLIENPFLMQKISKNNIKEAKEKYDVKIICNKLIDIYENISKRKMI